MATQADPPPNSGFSGRQWLLIVGVGLLILGLWFFKREPQPPEASTAEVAAEDLGEIPNDNKLGVFDPESPQAAAATAPETIEKPLEPGEGIPMDILEDMHLCLKGRTEERQGSGLVSDPAMSGAENPESEVSARILRTEEALGELEKDLGPPMMQGDLWTDWIVRLPDGLDRKVHLENIEDDEGRIQQSLSLFQIDQSGKASQVSLSESEEHNPASATIANYLNQGEIQRKESARFYQYTTGERLELIELDGKPSELEVVRGDVFFRCDNLKSTDNCTCIR